MIGIQNNLLKKTLFDYCLRLGDNGLILGHRLSEWCGHGPILEEDIALTNIALDLIGQSRLLLTYAAEIESKGRTEDDLAYLRNEREFKNALIVEQPNGDFACTIARQFFCSAYSFYVYEALKSSKDKTLQGIAGKAFKEVTYHLRHSREWLIRLGDGTEESHQRMQNAVNDLWMFTGDLFDKNENDERLISEGIFPDINIIKPKWDNMIKDTITKAKIDTPQNTYMIKGSIEGKHTEHLGYLLAEMQVLPRTYPGAKW